MATLVFGMNVSLDGFVDHDAFAPDRTLFRHFVDHVGTLAGSLYGRRLYEIMSYWDEDQPDWSEDEHDFATAWRSQPKWVVSKSLTSVGPNATLVSDDVETAVRRLKQDIDGEIDLGGPVLAHSLGALGLIDEYRLYLHPFVVGKGSTFFRGARPPLQLVASDRIGEQAIRLTYRPA